MSPEGSGIVEWIQSKFAKIEELDVVRAIPLASRSNAYRRR